MVISPQSLRPNQKSVRPIIEVISPHTKVTSPHTEVTSLLTEVTSLHGINKVNIRLEDCICLEDVIVMFVTVRFTRPNLSLSPTPCCSCARFENHPRFLHCKVSTITL